MFLLPFGILLTRLANLYSGVARAFPGGRPAHPEPQIEEENGEKFRKDERKSRRMRKNWGNVAFLPTWGWESDYAPEPVHCTHDYKKEYTACLRKMTTKMVLWNYILNEVPSFTFITIPHCFIATKRETIFMTGFSWLLQRRGTIFVIFLLSDWLTAHKQGQNKSCLVVLYLPPLIFENWKKVFTVRK